MSVHAGEILHVGGNNVIDRIQSAGLGDVNLPIETIREVGNREVVDKIPGEPDFTFTLESFDVSTDLMAWLTGSKPGTSATSAGAPGEGDAEGTAYDWLDCVFVNVPSPWKDPASGEKGDVEAGHLIPGYYPTRLRHRQRDPGGRACRGQLLLRGSRAGRAVRDGQRGDEKLRLR
jgi:hypothetical protein